MKKLIIATIVAGFAFTVAPAYAEGGGKLKKLDLNGDGQISKSEFLSKAETRFQNLDKDGNGFITRDEHKAGRETHREKRKEKRQSRSDLNE